MKAQYYTNWKKCVPFAKSMWRFYCSNKDAAIDQMTTATYLSWIACHAVYMELDPAEREILDTFFTAPLAKHTDSETLNAYARQKGIETNRVWCVVNKAYRLVAVERGLADQDQDGKERMRHA